jgi:hypothetical protein
LGKARDAGRIQVRPVLVQLALTFVMLVDGGLCDGEIAFDNEGPVFLVAALADSDTIKPS